ncbi:DUF72 domain-containing protein [Flavitalea flava]
MVGTTNIPRTLKELFLVGTSNIVLSEPNKQAFPAAYRLASHLSYYASLFNSVEINRTFYKLPLPATIGKWAAEVPDGFLFSFKLWKEISHKKNLSFNGEDVSRFMQTIGQAGNKKGCLLVQLPPGTGFENLPQLKKLLEEIEKNDPDQTWKIAVEFRHPSWYKTAAYSLLDNFKASVVLHDMPASKTMHLNDHAPFVYVRFHGVLGDYRGSYPDESLAEYALQIRQWLDQGKKVYAYFNNTADKDAPKNARTIYSMLSVLS